MPNDGACLAVVADGLGSRANSRTGARAATLAARDAWQLWRRSAVGTTEDLIRLVEVCWRLRLGDTPPETACTTCLLYVEDGRGRAALAQLGDGILVRHRNGGEVEVHPSRSHFAGCTEALGSPHHLADWTLTTSTALVAGEAVMMATDGVAEDLEPASIPDLVTWVIEDLGRRPQPGRALARELHNWPVPHHRDDKTLLVLWKP